jgi:hypothetical protein
MKKISPALYVLTVIAVLLISSCTKDNHTNNNAYTTSLSAWTAYKASVSNSYVYTTSQSSFTGYSSETTITVISGKITNRDYVSYKPDRTVVKEWHETYVDLGSHSNEGSPLLTIDDIYVKAKNEWLNVDSKANTIYFETKNNGILSTAGYVPNNCMDDCFTGINIKSITGFDL